MGVESVATYSQFDGNSMLNCRNWPICYDWSASPSMAVFGEMDSFQKNINRLHVSALGWSSQPGQSKKWKTSKINSRVFNHQNEKANGEAVWDPPFFWGRVWGEVTSFLLKPSSHLPFPKFQPCILCGFCHFVLVHPALVELCKWDPADLVEFEILERNLLNPWKMARSNCKIYTPEN